MDLKQYQEQEKLMGESMAKYQQSVVELTGLDPRGGQLGPPEIYTAGYKAAVDYSMSDEFKTRILEIIAEAKKTDIII